MYPARYRLHACASEFRRFHKCSRLKFAQKKWYKNIRLGEVSKIGHVSFLVFLIWQKGFLLSRLRNPRKMNCLITHGHFIPTSYRIFDTILNTYYTCSTVTRHIPKVRYVLITNRNVPMTPFLEYSAYLTVRRSRSPIVMKSRRRNTKMPNSQAEFNREESVP